MAITLTVEDGSVVTGANTYVSLADATLFCSNLGLTAWALEATEDQKAAILRGMAFIESQSYVGIKEDQDNPLKWPRSSAYDEDGYAIDEDEVPTAIVSGLCRAAYEELIESGCLLPNAEGGTKREKIDVIETEYFQNPGGSSGTVFQSVLAYLRPFLSGSGTSVNVVRC